LVGRELQKHFGQAPQVVLTMPILEGLDGVQKMSKSLGNYIGIDDAPNDMFGKLMSISDWLLWRYIDLLSFKSPADIVSLQKSVDEGANPRDIKIEFAEEIVERFHSRAAATRATQDFIARFKRGEMPEDIAEVTLTVENGTIAIANLLKNAGLTSSTSDAIRMIKQGAVKIDGERVDDRALKIPAMSTHVYQVGKRRFARVKVNE